MLPGLMSIGGFLGEAAGIVQTDSRTTAATSHTSVNFGAATDGAWVGVLAFHGNTSLSPGQVPTATIGGTAANRIIAHSTGDGVGLASGVALFTAQPGVTSGTVAVATWGGLPVTILVFRTFGYNLGSAFSTDKDTSLLSINVPNLGLTVGAVQNASGTGNVTWTNLTERGDETANSKIRSWAWDFGMATQTGRTISPSPWSGVNGATAVIAASFSLT